jgi:hypothetical protein
LKAPLIRQLAEKQMKAEMQRLHKAINEPAVKKP